MTKLKLLLFIVCIVVLVRSSQFVEAKDNATEVMMAKSWDRGVVIVTADGLYGTGWFISKDTIITAGHVVEFKYKTVDVVHGSYHSKGNVIYIDKKRDIAVIRVKEIADDVFIFRLAKKLKKTETIYVIGYPYELLQIQSDVKMLSANPRCAKGTISWIDVKHGIAEITAHTDAGNSGGPVVNEDGEVVGLVTFAIIGRASTLYFITIHNEVEDVLNHVGVPYKEEFGISYETKQTIKYSLFGAIIVILILVFGKIITRRRMI